MNALALALVLAACSSGSGRKAAIPEEQPPPPITVEWKVEQGEGDRVNVTLVVEGQKVQLGALDAATENEAGTPNTCALRAASPRRTELVCGDVNAYAAELGENELVILLLAGETRTEVKRVPVYGGALAVKMLLLPGSKP